MLNVAIVRFEDWINKSRDDRVKVFEDSVVEFVDALAACVKSTTAPILVCHLLPPLVPPTVATFDVDRHIASFFQILPFAYGGVYPNTHGLVFNFFGQRTSHVFIVLTMYL